MQPSPGKILSIAIAAALLGALLSNLNIRIRKLEAEAKERSAASSLAQIRKLVNSQFPESFEIYRDLLANGIEVIRVERTSPETCAVTAPDSGGKPETFFGIPGNWPEEPSPDARPRAGAPGSASKATERTAASQPEAPPQ